MCRKVELTKAFGEVAFLMPILTEYRKSGGSGVIERNGIIQHSSVGGRSWYYTPVL